MPTASSSASFNRNLRHLFAQPGSTSASVPSQMSVSPAPAVLPPLPVMPALPIAAPAPVGTAPAEMRTASAEPSVSDQLAVAETIIADLEQRRVMPAAPPDTLTEATPVTNTAAYAQAVLSESVVNNQVPPPTISRSSKETAPLTVEQPVETATGLQYVEEEKTPEIPVEVEGYLSHVQDYAQQQPQEIVIADQGQSIINATPPKQAVIVLPLTPEMEEAGAKKGPSFGIRWLVEWSRKLMKMFSGKIIYKQVEPQS